LKGKYFFNFEDKIRAFLSKINPWMSKIEYGNYVVLKTLQTFFKKNQYGNIITEIQQNIRKYLEKSELTRFFPELIRKIFWAKVKESLNSCNQTGNICSIQV
jgi:hypothetical protein